MAFSVPLSQIGLFGIDRRLIKAEGVARLSTAFRGTPEMIFTDGMWPLNNQRCCGQASRSVKWLHTEEKFFNRLTGRYQQSLPKGFDRTLKGNPLDLELLRNKCHDHEMIFRFVIVQPAISAAKISADQLAVLGTSYSYIKNVSGSDVRVVTSA